MNLAEAFACSAERHKEKTAVFWGEKEVSYADIRRQARQVALWLRATVNTEDRVGIWLKNCPEFKGAFFGILEAGAVVVPINNFLKPEEVAHIIDDAGIKLVISDSSMADQAETVRKLRPGLRIMQVEDFARNERPAAVPLRPGGDGSEVAVLIYTSGTTGRSKGAMLTHRNLLSNVESCAQALMVVEADRLVVLLPLFHSFMMTVGMLLPILVGGSIVLIRSLHPPKN